MKDVDLNRELIQACFDGRLSDLHALVKQGADIKFKDDKEGNPMFNAVFAGHLDCMDALLGYGIDVDEIIDEGNWTPLMVAAERELMDIIKHLLVRGAKVNAKNDKDNTALHWAMKSDSVDCVAILLDRGADMFIKNKDGLTPLDVIKHGSNIDGYIKTYLENKTLETIIDSRSESEKLDF